MSSNYTLLTSQSSIRVLSPTVVQDVIVATLQTKPHGVIFDYYIDKITWDAGNAPTILEAVAAGVEHIMASQPVTAASGSSQLDASGLLAGIITFTVAYPVPGSQFPPATVDVDIPVGDFGQDTLAGHNFGLEDAASTIQDAYAKLQAAAGVTPSTPAQSEG